MCINERACIYGDSMQKTIAPPRILNQLSPHFETPCLSVKHIQGKDNKQSSRPQAQAFLSYSL